MKGKLFSNRAITQVKAYPLVSSVVNHNSEKKRSALFFVLLPILFYEIVMTSVSLSGVSTTKVLVTLCLWFSAFVTMYVFFRNSRQIKSLIPAFPRRLLYILLIWNVFNILRSLLFSHDSFTTMFGNPFDSISLLLPFAIVLGLKAANLKWIRKYNLFLIFSSFIVFPLSFILPNFINEIVLLNYTTILFITTLTWYPQKMRIVIILSSLFLFLYVGAIVMSRTMFLRIPMLYFSLFIIYFYRKNRSKYILKLSFLSLILPFYFIASSIITGNSFFSTTKESISNGNSVEDTPLQKADTRTFIYAEVFADLFSKNNLLIGNGASGTYYSPYFESTNYDSDQRLTTEVGIMTIFLKGGFIAVFLNLTLLLSVIYFAFFKSKNYYTIAIGYMLLIHTILLFVENLVAFNTYNYLIWFFIGACLSNQIRSMNNEQFRALLIKNKT